MKMTLAKHKLRCYHMSTDPTPNTKNKAKTKTMYGHVLQ